MTRKDYELIAAALKYSALGEWTTDSYTTQEAHDCASVAHRAIAESVAHALAEDNARFDRARFLTACGVSA